jgi:hypothetical protein
MERVAGCRKLLMKRETTQRGAVELEAIGNDDAKKVLISGLESSDPEIRFFSAYSLSYLDRSEAIPVLMELARYEPAFRPLCLVGLSVNEDSLAREALEETTHTFKPTALVGIYISRLQRPGREGRAAEDVTYFRLAFCGELGEPVLGATLDKGIVRTLWMTPDEMRANAHRMRSPLVLRCLEDHLAGQRFALELIYTDPSVLQAAKR